MAPPALLRATLASLTLLTDPHGFWGTGTRATASPPAFERTAAAPTALATAHTLHVNPSGTSLRPLSAPLALTHGALYTHANAPAQPEKDPKAAQPNFTPAARTHNQPHHLNQPAASIHAHTTWTVTATAAHNAAPDQRPYTYPTTQQRTQHTPRTKPTAPPSIHA